MSMESAYDFGVEYNIYNEAEEYTDCTVTVLSNTITGDISIGWAKNKWHLISAEMPAPHTEILAWDGDAIFIDYYDGYSLHDGVTHWRELPEPPEDEANDY